MYKKPIGIELMNESEFASLCKALGHPARVKIVNYLTEMDKCVCQQIVDMLPLAQSTVSQHLRTLKNAGIIKGEIDGPNTCYCLDKGVMEKFQAMARVIGRNDYADKT